MCLFVSYKSCPGELQVAWKLHLTRSEVGEAEAAQLSSAQLPQTDPAAAVPLTRTPVW